MFQTRRGFLQTAAAALASLILPNSPRKSHYWFLQADTGNSWPIADPVLWSLENARQSILERASAGLMKLTPEDGDRIIRLVTRRCHLNLLELHPRKVVVHHWGTNLADLRPFFKTHGLARQEIEVVVKERKQETSTTQTGDDFLFGERFHTNLLKLFLNKWERRFELESDDWSAAPGTHSGYAWEGLEDNSIPWAALKSAWRRTGGLLCLNCSELTFWTNFGFPWTGMFSRSPRFIHVCGGCRRSFRDESVKDVRGWMLANLDALPDYEMVWHGHRGRWEGKAKAR